MLCVKNDAYSSTFVLLTFDNQLAFADSDKRVAYLPPKSVPGLIVCSVSMEQVEWIPDFLQILI